uniref:Uncharacterized protein n=1 Tax=Anopheles culicifacies TaxID=139723 RepID=A0A182MA56_9DIPT
MCFKRVTNVNARVTGPTIVTTDHSQTPKYDQRNGQYLAQRATNLTLGFEILFYRFRHGLFSRRFARLQCALVLAGVGLLQIDTFIRRQGFALVVTLWVGPHWPTGSVGVKVVGSRID